MENVENMDVENAPEIVEDPWESAEAAFDSVEPEGEKVAEVKAPESHIEPEIPEYLRLDDLKVPHKYKDEVKGRIQKVVSDFEAKQKTAIEAVNQELGQNKEAVVGLVTVFRDLAQTSREDLPNKIAGLIEQYGQNLGLDPSTAQNFRTEKQVQRQEEQAVETIQGINKKYSQRMTQTQDPREFMALWEQADLEKANVMESQMLSKVGFILKAYHDKYIAPDKQTLEEFKTKSQKEAETQFYNAKRTSWSSAADTLKSKYPDFEKYKSKIGEMIKSKKSLAAARDSLNKEPDDVESRQEFLESLYFAVSRSDAIESVKRPHQGGLPPSQKHIQTRKSETSGNWDAVWESQKDQWT